jgi:hypothetical protein
VAGGVYLGQDREIQQQNLESQLVLQSEAGEFELLKERHNEHAAARAPQRKAEADAAAKAAREAKNAASRARKVEAAAIRRAAAVKAEKSREDGTPPPFTGPIPESCNEFSGNRRIGCALMLDRGWEIDQFPCLDKLWKKESGWNHKAANRSSGAYGIPQALPGSKMKSAGRNWRNDPAVQVKWGLGYIKSRYRTPCNAWAHSQSHGWY